MAVEIQAEQNEANLLLCQDAGGLLKSRVDASGTFITRVNAEPDSSGLAVGECAWWFDGNNKVMFKARKDASTVYTGFVQLGP
jgi:hypothetical protein